MYFCTMNEFGAIKRYEAVRIIDSKANIDGKGVVFSIEFYKKNGELVRYPYAVACGLRANMTKNRIRGIVQTDAVGNAIARPRVVSIDNIRMFNGKRVEI